MPPKPARMAPALPIMRTSPTDTKSWARALRNREFAGERLLPCQERGWREALGSDEKRHIETEEDREAREERLGIIEFGS